MRAWEEFLITLEKELGLETVNKWLRPLKIIRFDACNLYLEAEDSFKAMWFEEHIRLRAKTSLLNNNNKPIKIHLTLESRHSEEKKEKKKEREIVPSFSLVFDEIDEKCRFDNFITSQSNLLAFKILCESCSLDPKTLQRVKKEGACLSFNPIYLFGRKGTGKTHLLMAIARNLKEMGKKVIYTRAETFTEHVVNAIRTGEMQTFRKMYRTIDALLIDDIEVFSRKGATQEELFHTFNTLHVEGKQIILSASSTPQELKFIEPRLSSRFEWGIVIPLQTLGKEELREVLIKRAESLHFALPQEVEQFLLESFGSNTKALIRSLEALVLRTHLNHSTAPMSLQYAQNLLSDLILEEEKAVLTPSKIIRTVAEFYGIRMDDILSKSQSRESSLPRQIAMHLCRNALNIPFMKIGDIFARDHSTVMSSVKHIQKALDEKNQEITSSISTILKRLE